MMSILNVSLNLWLRLMWTCVVIVRVTQRFPWGCPRGVMVKAMDCGIVVSEFILQSCYYVHFQANTLWKGMNPLSSQLWVK